MIAECLLCEPIYESKGNVTQWVTGRYAPSSKRAGLKQPGPFAIRIAKRQTEIAEIVRKLDRHLLPRQGPTLDRHPFAILNRGGPESSEHGQGIVEESWTCTRFTTTHARQPLWGNDFHQTPFLAPIVSIGACPGIRARNSPVYPGAHMSTIRANIGSGAIEVCPRFDRWR